MEHLAGSEVRKGSLVGLRNRLGSLPSSRSLSIYMWLPPAANIGFSASAFDSSVVEPERLLMQFTDNKFAVPFQSGFFLQDCW